MFRYLFFFLIFISFILNSQTYGSGTITINTEDNLPYSVWIQADNLNNNQGAFTSLYGNTNEPIPFSWILYNSLGNAGFELKDKVKLIQNPSSRLYIILDNVINKDFLVSVYDINGREVLKPSLKYENNNFVVNEDVSQLIDGIYFVMITSEAERQTIKFIKNNTPFIADVNRTELSNLWSRNSGQDNYRVVIRSNFIDDKTVFVEVVPGDNNNIIIDAELSYQSPESGDVAINAVLSSYPKQDFTATLTNLSTPDSTYIVTTPTSQAIFWNVYVDNDHNPSTYQVDILSNDDDPNFLPTTTFVDVFQDDEGEVNGSKTVELNSIANQQDIIMVVRNYDDLELLEGATVEMSEATVEEYDPIGSTPSYLRLTSLSNNIIDVQTSDSNGIVNFENVQGGTDVYFKVYKDGYYRKTNTFYGVPEVNRISEMDTLLNITAVEKLNYWDGAEVYADTLMWYRPQLGVNTEFVLGHMNIHIGDDLASIETDIKDHLDDLAVHLGFPNAFQYAETPFPETPTIDSWSYNPYPYERNVYEGQIGYNLVAGSSQNTTGQIYTNGNKISFHGIIRGYSGLGFPVLDHELGHALGLIHIAGTWFQGQSVMPFCCTGVNTAQIITSKYDTEGLRLWYRLAKLHFDTLDSGNRLMDYAMTIRIDEYDPINENMDDDNDGVINLYDNCPNTPETEIVNEYGCSESQLDDDFDGINNTIDLCPETPYGDSVDENGCSI